MSETELDGEERGEVAAVEREQDSEEESLQSSSVEELRIYKLEKAITKRMLDLSGDLSGLDGLSRFAFEVDVSPIRQKALIESRQRLAVAYAKYTSTLKAIEPKNFEGRTLVQLEDIVKGIILSVSAGQKKSRNMDTMMQSRLRASEKYREIRQILYSMGISTDPVCVGAWFGIYGGLREGFVAAYDVLRLCMEEVCDARGLDRFPINDEKLRPYFMDQHFEIVTGDQNSPIVEKILLQLIVYAAYTGLSPKQRIKSIVPGKSFTLTDIFDVGAKTLCFGWLFDNYRPDFASFWQEEHENLDRMVSAIRPDAFVGFYQDVVVRKKLRLIPGKMTEFNAAFQIVDQAYWTSGALSGDVEEVPFHHLKFRYMSSSDFLALQSILGLPGGGKSTLLSAILGLSVIQKKTWGFIPLSDNSNWPAYAFMPQMPVPGNKSYRFIKDKLGLNPQGIPVIILDIVRNLSELEGETITKYDRIIKVRDHVSFRIDMEVLIDELGRVAEEFGYSKPAGLIAVRYLGRVGTSELREKRYSVEIQNAVNMLDSFNSWRRNHTKIPCRLAFDEIKETGLGQAKSRDQSQFADLIESGANAARRHNYSMDFVGHLPSDFSQRVREFTENTFWRNLPEERSEAKSPQAILLESLKAPADQKEAAKLLSRSRQFNNERLFFWHSKKNQQINVVQPVPPTFMPQVPHKDPPDVYNFYLKHNPTIDSDKFYRRKADLKFDWIASSGDGKMIEASETLEHDEAEETAPKESGAW